MHAHQPMNKITAFNFPEGKSINGKYEIARFIGGGWEGEVYLLKEKKTGIERAAKFFFPHRNAQNKTSDFHAKKLHKLKDCQLITQYHFQGEIQVQKQAVTYIVSEFIKGEMISTFTKAQSGKRLQPFEAVHLLHTLAKGMTCVHDARAYHGDLHSDNIIIQKTGIGFKAKAIDFYNYGQQGSKKDDITDLITIFHEVLGGQKHYAKHPACIKRIISGLKKTLILKKFPTMRKLQEHLETMAWD